MKTDQILARLKLNHPGLYEQLGKKSDAKLAEEYKLTRSRIHQLRTKLGIEKVPSLPPERLDEIKSKLGNESDKKIAQTFDIGIGTVRSLRQQLGIPSVSRRKYDHLIAPYESELGEISDAVIAKKAGVRTNAVFQYRKLKGILSKVYSPRNKNYVPLDQNKICDLFSEGKSDVEIAHALNITKSYVVSLRHKKGLYRARKRKQRVAP